MNFEPVLLETSLAAVLYLVSLTLRTPVKWYKLLFKVFIVFVRRHFQNLLQWTHVVFALTNVDDLIVGRNRSRV